MIRKILVPLDGSAQAEKALSAAMALARAEQGEVTLLRIPALHPVSVASYSGGYEWLYPEQAQEKTVGDVRAYLDAVARQWAMPDVQVHAQVESGDAAAVILDIAKSQHFDLICMTTHGYSGFTRWMLGSVTERVLRAAPCAVMVVREPRPIAHVLITLDGSPLAEKALAPGMEVARRVNARVTLLQVSAMAPIIEDSIYQMEVGERTVRGYLATNAREEAQVYLDSVAERLEEPGLPLAVDVVDGFAAQGILDYAAQNDVDLIVMATHGRTGLRRWAYGSVTEKVLRGGAFSLLVVRPTDAELNG